MTIGTGSRRHRIVALSARTATALAAGRARLAAHLEADPGLALDDVVATLARGREPFPRRFAVIGPDLVTVAQALRGTPPIGSPGTGDSRVAAAVAGRAPAGQQPQVVFSFTDAAGGYPGLGYRAYGAFEEVRRWLHRAAVLLRDRLPAPLPDCLAAHIAEPELANAFVFALEFGLAAQLNAWGISPDEVRGDGTGALTADAVTGRIGFDEALLRAARAETIHGSGGTIGDTGEHWRDWPASAILEIGPDPTVFARSELREDRVLPIVTLAPGVDEEVAILAAVAELWCLGVDVDLELGSRGRRLHLPGYAFDRDGSADRSRRDPGIVLAGAWWELFGVAPYDTDEFVASGGDALLMLRLRQRLATELENVPSVAELLAVGTFADLRAHLQRADRLGQDADGAGPGEVARPLTARQQRLIFHDLVRAGSTSAEHNAAAAVWASGRVDVDTLAAVFAEVQKEHPALRTVFRRVGDRWLAVERPMPLVSLAVQRLDGVADRDGAAALLEELAGLPFVPADSPLLRGLVAMADDGCALVALVAHEALADAAPLDPLLAEITERYRKRLGAPATDCAVTFEPLQPVPA